MARVFFISEKSVKRAWLKALQEVLYNGDEIETEYDKPGDPPSRDATVLIEVKDPFSEPITRNNKILKIKSKFGNYHEVYGNLGDTYLIGSIQSGYIEEIMEGVNDRYIQQSGTSFPYSYHDRIFNYAPYSLEDTIHKHYNVEVVNNESVIHQEKLIKAKKIEKINDNYVWKLEKGIEIHLDKEIKDQMGFEKLPMGIFNFPRVNQIHYIIEKLKKNPCTRRAQAITWRPLTDLYHFDPPCLQRIYMRIKDDQLLMQTTWRSRDLFRAWEANVNGMIRIQKYIAEQLNVEIGHYVDFNNSLHIYGKTIPEVEDFLERMKIREDLPQTKK
ncbi:MAG: thymidylate synthase [Promethearchaeota archaeon]